MSAIAGIVFSDSFQIGNSVDNMLLMMGHRGGPNKETHIYRNFQIGSSGQKLAINAKRSCVCLLDGTITNFSEVKEKLIREGVIIESEDFGHLIIQAYETWGIKFTDEIDGDFAIALLDRDSQQLLLVRDRVGLRPLYWYQDSLQFIFASELKGILGSGLVSNGIAPDAIGAYLVLGYIPQDMSPINKVNKLLPGYYLKFDGISKSLSINSYWSYSNLLSQKSREDPKTLAIKLDDTLSEAVRIRLPEDLPVACFLSGGLGSTAVGYYLQKNYQPNLLSSYSVCYLSGDENVQKEVNKVAKSLKMRLSIGYITPENFLNDFVKLIWYLDEPLADPNILLTWKLMQMVKDHASVVFSGTGSHVLLKKDLRGKLPTSELRNDHWNFISLAMKFLMRLCPKGFYHLLKERKPIFWLPEYLQNQMIFNDSELKEVSPQYANYFSTEVLVNKFYHIPRIRSRFSIPHYFDFKTQLVDSNILQFDRFTSANQLSWRTPLFDRKVIECLASFPSTEKGHLKVIDQFLDLHLRNIFPEGIPFRRMNRNNPMKSWVENSELHSLFELLTNGILAETGIISGAWVQKQVSTFEGRANAFPQLWSLLVLEVWYRLYVQEPLKPHVPNMPVWTLLYRT
jgi:asparagine synthase (glutamine-hydrolysing)